VVEFAQPGAGAFRHEMEEASGPALAVAAGQFGRDTVAQAGQPAGVELADGGPGAPDRQRHDARRVGAREQGGGGLDRGERVVPARQVAQQAGEAERPGARRPRRGGRERVLAVAPVGRTAGGGVGQGMGRGAGAHRGIEAAGEQRVAQCRVVRVDPGVFGGEAAGRFPEGEAGDQPVAERRGGGFGAGIEQGQRVLGEGERGEQGGGLARRRIVGRGRPALETGPLRLIRRVLLSRVSQPVPRMSCRMTEAARLASA
jgi:hypothetical protein